MPMTPDEMAALLRDTEALRQAGRHPQVAEIWRQAAAAAPGEAHVLHNLGAALFEIGDYAGAEAALRRAVDLSPNLAAYHFHLGVLLHFTGRLEAAIGAYETARLLEPSPATDLNLAHVLLALGRFREGWALYERRKAGPEPSGRLDKPGEWRGEPIEGRSVLIWPEQGFGDQIQFARFAPMLAARGAEVTLVAPDPLFVLFRELPVKVVGGPAPVRVAAPDHWTNPMSIPHFLGLGADIGAAPYLRAPQANRDRWAGRVRPGAIGYAWRSRTGTDVARHKSMPGPDALLETLGRTWAELVDLTEPVGDFADMAAIIEQLDLVVAVDTAVAHLAGALGKPCWVMLPWFRCDWRWMQGRDDSPWYPRTRLFRQASDGDWAGVLEAVGRRLASEGWAAGQAPPAD